MRKYESQMQDAESSQKMIEELMERIASAEKEKASLVGQYERYSTISEEVASYKKRINEMSQMLETKEKVLEKERADKASIEHSQDDLLRKMKDLQKENDQLVIKLEGLKTENEGLLSKNKRLEDRIKSLDDQNKAQLKQINETLKSPVPLPLNAESLKQSFQKESENIDEKYQRTDIVDSFHALSHSNSSVHLSTSPPSLSIPTVNFSDEKRPASLVKDLKVIPKIVEPTAGSSDISNRPKEHGNTSTINSQDAPTIPKDSPAHQNGKAFADAFSRSCKYCCSTFRQIFSYNSIPLVSNDPPDGDDDFDPKTFSIDQVSDGEGVSELIEDEDDYEYLFNADNF